MKQQTSALSVTNLFSRTWTLKFHMVIHTGEKTYQCSQCDKAFNETSALMKHMRNHTGEKPYQCSQCDKAFSRTDYLKKHIMESTNIKKLYACDICVHSFNTKVNLSILQYTKEGNNIFLRAVIIHLPHRAFE